MHIMKRPRRCHEEEEDNGARNTVGNEEEESCDCSILRLPEDCLAHAISLTTPADACRSIVVSTAFKEAASSDAVWERFLPPDYGSILAHADYPVDLTSSKKELFLSLAQDPVLLHQRNRSFWLERKSGAKCYMLSSRSLRIIWGGYPLYWRQIYMPDSRFEEVSELLAVCWLDIWGSIDSRELSPNTRYAAYLVFRLADESYGLDCPTQEAFIYMDSDIVSAKRIVSLHPHRTQSGVRRRGDEQGQGNEEESSNAVSYPTERDDGWMEVELGEFYNHQGDTRKVHIGLLEHVQLHWKKGLICEGIEIRPKT